MINENTSFLNFIVHQKANMSFNSCERESSKSLVLADNEKSQHKVVFVINTTYPTQSKEDVKVVLKNGKYGIADVSGLLITPCIYDSITPFVDGCAVVSIARKFGVINQHGHLLVPCIYDLLGDLSDRLIFAQVRGKVGYVDRTGNEVVPCIYDAVELQPNGYAYVKMGAQQSYIKT